MKKLFTIILGCVLGCVLFVSCGNTLDSNTIYVGTEWCVKQLNDSTLICIPRANGFVNSIREPFLIHLKNMNSDNYDVKDTIKDTLKLNNYERKLE